MRDADDRVEELRSMFHTALDGVDPKQLSSFVDYYLEWYMRSENIKEITKVKGLRELRRVYEKGQG
tara:strand:+ start:3291 stop:3488 length:198 start_codon:yes stop_codon:yes gene_type:complete